jgi:hypothetical protein
MLAIRDLEAGERKKKMEMARGIALCKTPSLLPFLFATSSKRAGAKRRQRKKKETVPLLYP